LPDQVAARAATQESATPTRALGCHTFASASSVRASKGSPPIVSKPPAPIHQVPGAPLTGLTCGLAERNAADARASSRAITASSHASTSSAAHRDFASGTDIPVRTCAFAAAEVTARSTGRFPCTSAIGSVSQWGPKWGPKWGDALRPDHTAPIGNLGMRTHATRHFDVTVNFSQGKNFHGLVWSALLDHDGDAARGLGWHVIYFGERPSSGDGGARLARDAQSERARELGGFGVVTEYEERGVGFACEAGETDGDGAREHGCAVEDDEGERAAAQEDIGAPCAAGGVVGSHDPKTFVVSVRADVRPVARSERACGVDVRDRTAVVNGAFGDPADERGFSGAGEADEFGEAAAGEAVVGESGIECGDAGGEAGCARARAGDDFGEVLAEEG